MKGFLRDIRNKLVEEGRLRKYAVYAVSEIFLVVVGILIALQVNNWNESRKLDREEQVVLKELRADLEINVRRLDSCLRYDEGVVSSLDIIIEHLDKRLPYTEALDQHFPMIIEWCAYDFVDSAYENLKFTHGLDLLSDDSLRLDLAYLHESLVPFALGNIENDEATLNQEITLGLFTQLFAMDESLESASPINYRALLDNEQLKTVLKITKARRLWSIDTDTEIRDRTLEVLERIGAPETGS